MADDKNVEDKKPAFDPGWNDPPMLTTPNVQPATKRNILNKRVAFPLFNGNSNSATTASGAESISINTPPKMPIGLSLPPMSPANQLPPNSPPDQQLPTSNPNLPQ